MSTPALFGLLNVDKPSGMTSRQVVDRVQRVVRPNKVGHAGTLDPLAAGVLVVCVGRATRLVPFIQQYRKSYRAEFLLGRQSPTDDIDGDVVEIVPSPSEIPRPQIEQLLPRFVGRIRQIPPQFSAVHVRGQRAYQLARRGTSIEIPAKVVEVHRVAITDYRFPALDLEIECGTGTYIRAIGRDLGRELGCGAIMSRLVRSRIGPFTLEDAIPAASLDWECVTKRLLPARLAVQHLKHYGCTTTDLSALQVGRPIFAADDAWQSNLSRQSESPILDNELVALLTPDGVLAALALYEASTGQLAPRHVFLDRFTRPTGQPH